MGIQDTASGWRLYRYQGPLAIQSCGNTVLEMPPRCCPCLRCQGKLKCLLPKSRVVPPPYRLSSMGFLGWKASSRLSELLFVDRYSKLPGNLSSDISANDMFFHDIKLYLAKVTSPTATQQYIPKVKLWASNISRITQVMSATWARTSAHENNEGTDTWLGVGQEQQRYTAENEVYKG